MSRLKITFYVLKNYLLFKSNQNITFGQNMRIRGPIKLSRKKNSQLNIGDNFTLVSGLMLNPLGRNIKSMIRLDKGAKIYIGDNVGMSCMTLWAKEEIIIGNDVKVGADVIIMDSDMHSLDFKLRKNPETDAVNAVSHPIRIEDDVFIGTRAIITKGVSIGKRSIIAAGSVVSKSIPQDEIWGGNPARFIRKLK